MDHKYTTLPSSLWDLNLSWRSSCLNLITFLRGNIPAAPRKNDSLGCMWCHQDSFLAKAFVLLLLLFIYPGRLLNSHHCLHGSNDILGKFALQRSKKAVCFIEKVKYQHQWFLSVWVNHRSALARNIEENLKQRRKKEIK